MVYKILTFWDSSAFQNKLNNVNSCCWTRGRKLTFKLFLYHIRRIQSQFKPYMITQKKLGLGLKPKPQIRIDQKEKQECESILPNVKPNVKNLNIKYFSLVFFKFLS